MAIKYHEELIQGSDEWHQARLGLLTASEMSLIITPTLKIADNDKTRTHIYELLAQRVTGYVEPHYISDDMLRGHEDEVEAKILYADKYAPTMDVGFVTNDKFGFTIGFSPDSLVGDNGLIECKSRRQKYQAQTIAEDEVPKDYIIQIQTGLLVTEREWCDFVSYCGGMPMYVKRVYADPDIQGAIIAAASAFEFKLTEKMRDYDVNAKGLHPTERKEYEEIIV